MIGLPVHFANHCLHINRDQGAGWEREEENEMVNTIPIPPKGKTSKGLILVLMSTLTNISRLVYFNGPFRCPKLLMGTSICKVKP